MFLDMITYGSSRVVAARVMRERGLPFQDGTILEPDPPITWFGGQVTVDGPVVVVAMDTIIPDRAIMISSDRRLRWAVSVSGRSLIATILRLEDQDYRRVEAFERSLGVPALRVRDREGREGNLFSPDRKLDDLLSAGYTFDENSSFEAQLLS